jgi:hypothetical protein
MKTAGKKWFLRFPANAIIVATGMKRRHAAAIVRRFFQEMDEERACR